MILAAAYAVATISASIYELMDKNGFLVNLESTLSSALSFEARGDADAAFAKTATHSDDQDYPISESDNWKSAQQCFDFILSTSLIWSFTRRLKNCGKVFNSSNICFI